MTRMIVLFFICLPVFSLAGCSDDDEPLTVEQTLDEFLPVFCEKLKSCIPDGYAEAFPNGQSDCVDLEKSAVPDENLSKPSVCSKTELDACIHDMNMAQCSSLPDKPPSCSKC